MEVLDRYLEAVRFWLPTGQRADIVAELSEDLRSEVEDREAEAGRKLDEAELEALLKGRGHPMRVAEGYMPKQHLIGPMVLPIYRRVVTIGLASLAVIFATLYIVFRFAVEAPPQPSLRSAEFWIWQAGVYGFALVGVYTMIFAAIERAHGRPRATQAWDPRHPKDPPRAPADAEAERRQRIRVAETGELFGSVVFTLWWLGVVRLPATPGLEITLSPAWQGLFWPILVLGAADVVLGAVTMVRARRTRLLAGLSLFRNAYGLVLVALVLSTGRLVEVAVAGVPPDRHAGFAYWVNLSVAITIGAIGASYLARAIRDARVLRNPGPQGPARVLPGE